MKTHPSQEEKKRKKKKISTQTINKFPVRSQGPNLVGLEWKKQGTKKDEGTQDR